MATIDAAALRAKIEVTGADRGRADIRSVGDQADKTKSKLSGLGGGVGMLSHAFSTGLGAVAGTLTGFLGFGIVTNILGGIKDGIFNLVQAGIQGNASMEQLQIGFTTMLGSGEKAKAFLDDLRDFANKTPFEFPELAADAQLLLAMGFNAKQVVPIMTAVGDATAALGGGEDKLNRIVTALGQMQTKGKASSEEIMQMSEAGVPALQLLADGFDVSKAQMQQMITQGLVPADKAVKIITTEMEKRYGGLMDKQSHTFLGLISTIKDFADTAINKAMAPVFKLAEEGIDHLATAVESPEFQDFIDNTAMVIQALMTNVASVINDDVIPAVHALLDSPFVQTLEGWAGAIVQNVSPSLGGDQGIKGSADAAKGGLAGLSTQAGTTGTALDDPNLAKHAKNAASAIQGIADAATKDPGGAGPALATLNKDLAMNEQSFQNSGKAAKDVKPFFTGLGEAFGNLGGKIGDAAGALGQFKDDVQKRFGPAEPAIDGILETMLGDFDMFSEGVHEVWDSLWGLITAPVKLAFDTVQGVVNVGLDLFHGDLDQAGLDAQAAWNKILSDAGGFKDSLGGLLEGIEKMVLSHLAGPFKQAADYLSQLFNEANSGKSVGLNAVSSALDTATGGNSGRTPGRGKRASGGPISGPFLGAERGMELLVTPGIYDAPPGSYVYNNRQTKQLLGGGGNTYVTYHITATTDDKDTARSIESAMRRRELLIRLGG